MRKKLFLLGVMSVLLVVFILFSLISSRTRGGVCEQLIHAVQENDVQGSYDLLSSEAQALSPFEEWKQNVASLDGYYGDAEPELKSKTQETFADTGLTQTKEEYLIDPPNGTYTAYCYVSQNGKEVNAFSSQLKPL
ncbi:MAG TPA: hypothetical protein VJ836_07175 [Candidatus Saccharimonadales bacterium]|nr:hypothetical protein [Candidatus Saccharimonadales bacterium]